MDGIDDDQDRAQRSRNFVGEKQEEKLTEDVVHKLASAYALFEDDAYDWTTNVFNIHKGTRRGTNPSEFHLDTLLTRNNDAFAVPYDENRASSLSGKVIHNVAIINGLEQYGNKGAKWTLDGPHDGHGMY